MPYLFTSFSTSFEFGENLHVDRKRDHVSSRDHVLQRDYISSRDYVSSRQRHPLGAVKKSKLCGTAPDYKGKMCGKVR